MGSGRTRSGHKIPTASFLEGDSITRKHLHFILQTSEARVSGLRLNIAIAKSAYNLEWAYKIIDVRPITYGRPAFVAEYCLKTGTDAFLPEASFLSTNP